VVWRRSNSTGGRDENLRGSIYNPLFAAPFGVLTYEWKNSLDSADGNYLFPAACLAISTFRAGARFWALLLTYITNRFAGQIEADAPLALAVVGSVETLKRNTLKN